MAFEDLEITEFPDALGPDHFHFLAQKHGFHGRTLRGFGSARDRTLALQKAVGELIERSAFFTDSTASAQRSSSGYASHENEAQARETAVAELLERDIVLTHWLQRLAPHWLAEETLPAEVRILLQDLNARLKPLGYRFTVGLMAKVGDYWITAGLIRSPARKIGFTFSSSAGKDLASELLAVISDMRRNISILRTRERAGEPLFRVMRESDLAEPDDHREFYLDPAHAQGLEWFFAGSEDVLSYDMPAVQVEPVPIPIKLEWKCHAVRASCAGLQAYFVGMSEPGKLNLGRLGGETALAGLNLRVHPLP